MNETLEEILWPDTPFHLKARLVLACRRGSESHGTYVPPTDPNAIDDRDIMGIVVPPLRYYFGLDHWEGAESIKDVWDVVLYEIRKYVRLLCQQNPNVLSTLYLRDEDYLFIGPIGRQLIAARRLFRARHAAFNAFTGYAYSQLKRMTSFGKYEGYMGAKRKALVEKFGWDTKNGAHLIRLLHMGEEYLRTGEFQVYRTWDRDHILAIKRGAVPLAAVQVEAEDYFARCREAYTSSPLPEEIDHQAVRELLLDALGHHFVRHWSLSRIP